MINKGFYDVNDWRAAPDERVGPGRGGGGGWFGGERGRKVKRGVDIKRTLKAALARVLAQQIGAHVRMRAQLHARRTRVDDHGGVHSSRPSQRHVDRVLTTRRRRRRRLNRTAATPRSAATATAAAVAATLLGRRRRRSVVDGGRRVRGVR